MTEYSRWVLTVAIPFKGKVAKATFAIGWDWVGMGTNGGLIDDIAARKPHPLPTSPLKRNELMRTAFMRLICQIA